MENKYTKEQKEYLEHIHNYIGEAIKAYMTINNLEFINKDSNKVMKYRKKPVIIDAVKWDGDIDVLAMFDNLTKDSINSYKDEDGNRIFIDSSKEFIIETLEGNHLANLGDMIIRGVEGEFYPCKPDIFDATYEKVK